MSTVSQFNFQKSDSNLDLDPDAITDFYQSRKGHMGNLTKYINRMTVMIDRLEPIKSIKELQDKIEFTMFKINKLTEKICLALPDNEQDRERAQHLCREHLERGNKVMDESNQYIEVQIEKLAGFNTNKSYKTYKPKKGISQLRSSTLDKLVTSRHSSSTFSSKISQSSKSAIAKAQLLEEQERIKAERKLEKLRIEEEQFKLQKEFERTEILEQLDEVRNKVAITTILNELEDESDLDRIERKRIPVSHNLHQQRSVPLGYQTTPQSFYNYKKVSTENISARQSEYPRPIAPKPTPPPKSCNNEDVSLTFEKLPVNNFFPVKSDEVKGIDKFIDNLVEGEETVIDRNPYDSFDTMLFLRADYESRNLPPIELLHFKGDPSNWPEFIENFSKHVHFKSTFNDNQRMERLFSLLEGEAKKMVQSIGNNGIFYACVLKALKREFGNPTVVAHLKLKAVFDLPQLKPNNKMAIRNYQQQLKATVIWLKSMRYYTSLNSIDNLTKAVMRLPSYLRSKFYKDFDDIELDGQKANLITFVNWLDSKLKETHNPIAAIINAEEKSKGYFENSKARVSTIESNIVLPNQLDKDSYKQEQAGAQNQNRLQCWLCSNDHKISDCEKLKSLNVENRRDLVKENRLCFNCLSNKHMIKFCKSKVNCKVENCNQRHHTLLHLEKPTNYSEPIMENDHSKINNHTRLEAFRFLQIVPITVVGKNGIKFNTNALLDTGSDTTLIRKDVADMLKLDGESKPLHICSAIGRSERLQSKTVDFQITSKMEEKGEFLIQNAWVMNNLNISYNKIDEDILNRYKHLNGIKFPKLNDSDVTVLIGTDHPELLLQQNYKLGKSGEPVAVQTALGWVLMGGRKKGEQKLQCNHITKESISNQIERFWAIDSYGTLPKTDVNILPPDQRRAVSILESTTTLKDNHFEVGLLWKSEEVNLPYNRELAVKRLITLERKFSKNEQFREMYEKQIEDYICKGYAKKLTKEESSITSERTNYIPHHGVVNINKPNKVRVVFDAAAKYQGTSLNDNLLTGIDLLNNLVSVLCRFRQGQYAVMADIEAMFHQIKVPIVDTNAMRFLWRNKITQEIEDYIMTVHIFGKKDSPCCANWALKSTAPNDNEHLASLVKNNFYMDDFLYSSDFKEKLNTTCIEITDLLHQHGFHLTKWIANDNNILSHIPKGDLLNKSINLDLNSDITERVLGMLWYVKDDTFSFRYIPKAYSRTKRGILSLTASIFDPLGILVPGILEAKLILQDLWKLNVDWDDELPLDILQRFELWRKEICFIENVNMNRWLGFNYEKEQPIELHIYSDASKFAYGAVAYFRFNNHGSIKSSFILSKSRLAPIKEKTLTIPRLELQAAVLAVRLKEVILETFDIKVSNTKFWIDSQIVLKYIQNESRKFNIFVMNRLNEIRLNSNIDDWKFIPGDKNPADLCTRYIPFSKLQKQTTWFNGPEDNIIVYDNNIAEYEIEKECDEKHNLNSNVNISPSDQLINLPWNDYSSYSKLNRQVAWLMKTIRNWVKFRKGLSTEKGYLTREDVQMSETYLLQLSQIESFKIEYFLLLNERQLPKNSKLLSFQPIIKETLIRVGGRIDKSSLPFESKHQIILSKDHKLSYLIVKHIHEKLCHSGREQTLAEIREKYWILNCRGLIKRVISQCLYCKRLRVKPQPPLMGALPIDRIDAGKPAFYNTGVDYFGPMITKQSRKTRANSGLQKRWGALFTCLTTRGIHLELVKDLSTDAFILAFRRFCARRGYPNLIRSDNGTNFVGTNRELREALKNLDKKRVSSEINENKTKWIFSPPQSPWMSGAMESMVKITKKALKTIVKDRVFTDDSLYTFMTEVESIVNSRPLTTISDNIDDIEALTPNHFLLGRRSNNTAIIDEENMNINLRSKWKAVQAATDMFWKKWIREYLPTLTERRKWGGNTPSLDVGNLVLISDRGTKRSNWQLGRITEILPGNDNVVRVVRVKTKDGSYIRPAASLALLENA